MESFIELLKNPAFWMALKVLAAYWVFSAAVGALSTPSQSSNPIYVWAFRFLHGLSGNINRAFVALKVPGVQEEKQ